MISAALALSVPATFFLALLGVTQTSPFATARRATALTWVLAVTNALAAVGRGQRAPHLGLLRLDLVTYVLLPLIATLGLVVVRYSISYLRNEPGRARYMRALLGVLGSVSLLIVSGQLLLLWAAWVGTSLALHQLLLFFRDRRAARIAAHKKFLVSRLADVALLGAFLLIDETCGSFRLDDLDNWVGAHPGLSPALQGAALLLVLGACLKSAQLPFHGWLLQVMEAPTPVSALLHAGVVNLGGVLMIRLAPLMAQAPWAQTLLVLIGTATAVLAALVMTTRVSVKVMLAWSTSAQMGFMLVECGLGAWRLALLHLVAHSLYKAYAFLGSGGVVVAWRASAPFPPAPALSLGRLVAGAAMLGLATAGAAIALSRLSQASGGWATLLTGSIWLSLWPLAALSFGGWRGWLLGAAESFGLALVYLGWHWAADLLKGPAVAPTWNPFQLSLLLLGTVPLLGLQLLLLLRPGGRAPHALHQWLFAGLYLDERFTRLTFWLWPPNLMPQAHRPVAAVLQET